ncbi:MAG: hypothetical protein II794_02160 [Oscillospiraceae bacterium]|nr:hypothetical protein [Oscillospiraceae bacterium]
MKLFSELGLQLQLTLVGVLFLCSLGQLALCLYEAASGTGARRRALDGAIMAAELLILSWLTAAAKTESITAPVPWGAVALMAPAAALWAALGLRARRRESGTRLTPNSVKETLDDLDTGIFFADSRGRAVLINHAMEKLTVPLVGSIPQTLDQIQGGLEPLAGDGDLYRLPDGRSFRIVTRPLEDPGLEGFTQTTAQDVTDLVRTNERLRQENEDLGRAIDRMLEMVENMSELVPRQEALDLKIRVHNEIGSSLIALSELADLGRVQEAQEQVRTLREALRYFSGTAAWPATLNQAQERARSLGAALTVKGTVPPGLEGLITAAALECVTNCLRHAGGRNVFCSVETRDGVTRAEFGSDGRLPAYPIREGGGLTGLRRKTESLGGTMELSTSGPFRMILTLSEGRYDL